jgi:dolichol-phosphate mannosyltransferase
MLDGSRSLEESPEAKKKREAIRILLLQNIAREHGLVGNEKIIVEFEDELRMLSHLHLLRPAAGSEGVTYEITDDGLRFLEEYSELKTVKEAVSGMIAERSVSKDDVTIVITALNEADAVVPVIDELRGQGYSKILVVDGYSTDATAELAERGAEVVQQVGTGKTGALVTAVDFVSTPYMLVMNCDCTYDPSCIETMLNHIDLYDEIIGARMNGTRNIPWLNRIGNRLLSSSFSLLFGVRLRDVCSGIYMLRTEVARHLEFSTGRFDLEAEIASQVASSGRVTEIPVNYRPRVGKQKLKSFNSGAAIMTSMISFAHRHNPVLLFSTILAFALVPAFAVLGWVTYERLIHNVWHSGYALFGVMLMLVAAQALAVGTMSILVKRVEHRIMNNLRTARL